MPLLAALFFIVLSLLPQSAQGEEADQEGERSGPGLRVVMLEVSFTDSIQEPLRERISGSLVAAMRRQGLIVIDQQAVAIALRPLGRNMSESCRGGRCVGWILEVLDGDAGLVAAVDGFENSYSVTVTMLGAYGNELGRAERRCDICTFDELASSIATAGMQIAEQLPRRIRSGRVAVFPNPEDSEISVNGASIGRGALSLPLPVGPQRVSAAREGYIERSEVVSVPPGASIRLDLSLLPGTPPEPRPPPPTRDARPWCWASFAIGMSAVIAGAVMMGVARAGDDGGQDTLVTVGAGLVGGGLGLSIAGGVALFFIPTPPDDEDAEIN